MEYKQEYMAEYYTSNEPNEYVITQEVIILRSYTVEASSLSNAIEQIESEDYTGVISEDDSVAEVKKGRVVSAMVNDYE
jgi:arginine repressor